MNNTTHGPAINSAHAVKSDKVTDIFNTRLAIFNDQFAHLTCRIDNLGTRIFGEQHPNPPKDNDKLSGGCGMVGEIVLKLDGLSEIIERLSNGISRLENLA